MSPDILSNFEKTAACMTSSRTNSVHEWRSWSRPLSKDRRLPGEAAEKVYFERLHAAEAQFQIDYEKLEADIGGTDTDAGREAEMGFTILAAQRLVFVNLGCSDVWFGKVAGA